MTFLYDEMIKLAESVWQFSRRFAIEKYNDWVGKIMSWMESSAFEAWLGNVQRICLIILMTKTLHYVHFLGFTWNNFPSISKILGFVFPSIYLFFDLDFFLLYSRYHFLSFPMGFSSPTPKGWSLPPTNAGPDGPLGNVWSRAQGGWYILKNSITYRNVVDEKWLICNGHMKKM